MKTQRKEITFRTLKHNCNFCDIDYWYERENLVPMHKKKRRICLHNENYDPSSGEFVKECRSANCPIWARLKEVKYG